jgi:hypothetical protein
MMRSVLIEWGRIVLLKPEATEEGKKERTVKSVVMEDVRRELGGQGGSSIARRVVQCARTFFSSAGLDTLYLVETKEKWGERVRESFELRAQIEYERELDTTHAGKKYYMHKPLWGKAAWLVATAGVRRWGQRKAVYQFFGLRANGHQLRSETSKHKERQEDGTYRVKCGCTDCRVCGEHKETPAKALFACKSMRTHRKTFEATVRANTSSNEWEDWKQRGARAKWKAVLEWSSGSWEGGEQELQKILYDLLTLVHEMYNAREHA